jgi:cation:H+ antiporter
MPLNDYTALIAGLVCAGIGGEVFVRGAVGLAHSARVSAGIIGATVAAFATSSPELSVSVSSAIAGKPQIALGDALGSSVVNVALILALALVVSGLRASRDTVRRDFSVALIVPVITGVLFLDGVLSRFDGLLLLSLFISWLVAAIIEARKQRSATEGVLGERRGRVALMLSIVGLGFLVGAGRLIVTGAKGIAISLGVDEFVVGATIVAVGTSVPELATAVIATLRGHSEIGLGTILGSNIFNGLFIVGVAAVIFPISVDWRELAAALVFGFLAVVLTFPTRGGLIERRRGVLLLMLYGMYLSAVTFLKAA